MLRSTTLAAPLPGEAICRDRRLSLSAVTTTLPCLVSYDKILSVSESKEANSSYGKGDIWALSETGRFVDGDDVVFCR